MKKILFFVFFMPILVLSETKNDKYSFVEYELPEKIVKTGGVSISKNKEGILDIDANVIGEQSSFVFKSSQKNPQANFYIFDLKPSNQVLGISIFTLSLDISQNFSALQSARNVDMLDRNHPFFNDQAWNIYLTFKGYEKITLSNRDFDSIHFKVFGDRPTGPGHCMYGGVGVFGVDSWYSKENGKLLKQVFVKRNCRPYDYKFLSKEVLELIP
jgi:hypothetical protein